MTDQKQLQLRLRVARRLVAAKRNLAYWKPRLKELEAMEKALTDDEE